MCLQDDRHRQDDYFDILWSVVHFTAAPVAAVLAADGLLAAMLRDIRRLRLSDEQASARASCAEKLQLAACCAWQCSPAVLTAQFASLLCSVSACHSWLPRRLRSFAS